ncbi:MAG TPA: DUF4093 domain-containing protein [Ruminococcus sp.]|nr:DUF4093 domain-containing protein [Ruminococcus sp.]
MIKINEAVIVEGKYDKIKLSSVFDAVIIVTNGFGIFRDRETLELIRFYAEKTGIIILTDSDSAGRKIRGYIKSAVKKGSVRNVYIPDVFGKEKRKEKPSAEGKLGVEGINVKLILDAFKKAGITASENNSPHDIDKTVLYELGLSGKPDSKSLRLELQKYLGLPSLMSASSLIEVLNTMMSKDELEKTLIRIREESDVI